MIRPDKHVLQEQQYSNGRKANVGVKEPRLKWLFAQIFTYSDLYDAVVIFDADTRVDREFLTEMRYRLQAGEQVIQGQHIISNPREGWFPALAWAMFLVDNRFQNRGRANLGFSAKNMGDAICFLADILKKLGWGEGLTEDYAFRQRLLLEGIKIGYEPAAKAYGQAAWNWQIAQKQRIRWLRGAQQTSRGFRKKLWVKGWQTRDPAMLEGALQEIFPSYSTLTLTVGIIWVLHMVFSTFIPVVWIILWSVALLLLFFYPLIGLALEGAPLRAYLVMMSGPIFILWRSWLNLQSRLGLKPVSWERTPHRKIP